MSKRRLFKFYGVAGHRQREAFNNSWSFLSSRGCRVVVWNHDATESFMYSILDITGSSDRIIEDEMKGQWGDGVYENCNVGQVVEIPVGFTRSFFKVNTDGSIMIESCVHYSIGNDFKYHLDKPLPYEVYSKWSEAAAPSHIDEPMTEAIRFGKSGYIDIKD